MSRLQFDAAPGHRDPIIPTNYIDARAMKGIEEDMDPEEILCCLFFLIEDYGSGYDSLMNYRNNEQCKSINDFVRENRTVDWEVKVMEALCLLQNNEILLKLGINPDEASTAFSTRILADPYRVEKHAKAFYSLFESLSEEDARILLDRVYRSTNPPDFKTWPSVNYTCLELHLLWWIRSGFIRIREDKWSLKNFLKVLKGLNMSQSIYSTLESYDSEYNYDNDNDISPCHLDEQASGNREIRSSNGGRSAAAVTDDGKNKRYQVRTGLVVVFNQMEFTGSTEYEYRYGSKLDCRRIEKTFRDKFGFETEIHENLGHNEIYAELDRLRSRGNNYDCIVVFFLSHGTYGNIVASDGIEYNIERIKSELCSSAWKEKPKVLVLQACQRPALRTDGPKTEQEDLGRFEDLLVLNSTIPGELSVRDERHGTWFIHHLCEVLVEEEGRPVDECLRELSSRFKKMAAEIDDKIVRQVPEYRTTLAKVLVLPWNGRA